MSRQHDLSGRRFGLLVAVYRIPGSRLNTAKWECLCDCGNKSAVATAKLLSGHTRSCGCLRCPPSQVTHGLSSSAEYEAWHSMKQRCLNPAASNYSGYGGRGIAICDRWANSFENFLADMGKRPSTAHSIDRIDNDCGYEPTNCRWGTVEQQQRNKRSVRRVLFDGIETTVPELADRFAIPQEKIRQRLRRGWSIEMAVK